MIGITEHIKEVSRWLDENVVSYPTPRTITLSGFEIDWNHMSGRFYVSFDSKRIEDPFRLSLAQNGWVQFHPPMFTSPLGAPASYSVVELTDETVVALTKALRSVFPRFKPMGLDRETGAFIEQRTPVAERIGDSTGFENAKSAVMLSGYQVTVSL